MALDYLCPVEFIVELIPHSGYGHDTIYPATIEAEPQLASIFGDGAVSEYCHESNTHPTHSTRESSGMRERQRLLPHSETGLKHVKISNFSRRQVP